MCLLLCAIAEAEENPNPEKQNTAFPDLREIEVSGPYCGIYSLIACLDTYGVSPELEELLVPEFVGSFEGSSNTELIKAAEKYGFYAKTRSGLTWRELRESDSPMILHFRGSYADSRYNHWVAYLGVDGEKARIIDLPHRITTIPFAELLAKWDGTAIEISQKPITDGFTISSRWNYLSVVFFFISVIFAVKLCFWNANREAFSASTLSRRCKLVCIQTFTLLGLLFVLGILYHAFSEIGFLKNPSAVAEVTRRYYSVDIPEIDLSEMKEIVVQKSIPVFDARYTQDFSRGTIPGAKSLSVASNLSERQEVLGEISRTERIVVFCQSGACGYADEVAQFLKFNGYENVVIYRGGYRDWKKNHEPEL